MLERTTGPGLLALCLAAGCAGERVDPDARPDAGVDRPAARVDGARDGDEVLRDAGPVETGAVDGPARSDGGACTGNRDTSITRSELAFVVGATVLYTVNREGSTATVDTAGASAPGGRVWDFAQPRPEDQRVLDEVLSAQGAWWSGRYPDASFAAWIDRGADLHGVYRVSADALELLATVSREPGRTDLRMDPPVQVLRFPLTVGARWEQTVTARGLLNFTPLQNVTRYASQVDARGEARTPAGRFAVLRLRTDLDQSIPLTVFRRTRRTYTFLAECWGLVARVESVDGEGAEEFTRASEYRRLSL